MKDYCTRHKSKRAKRKEIIDTVALAIMSALVGSVFFFAR